MSASRTVRPPHVVRAPARGRGAAHPSLLRQIWAHREILRLLTIRDIRARYAGSMLGLAWNVIHPIFMVLIYIVILGSILSGKLGGSVGRGDYVVHLCAGIIPWLVFQDVVTRCSSTLIENAGLIKKVAFPEIVLHLSALLNALFIHAVSYATFIVVLALLGAWPGPLVLACFGVLVAVGLFALGVGLVVSVLNIYFRDVGQLVVIVLQFLFWFTPIVYFPSLILDQEGALMDLLGVLLEWNPLMHFTSLSQWLFGAVDSQFRWSNLLVVLLGPVVSLAAGLTVFQRFKHDILDNL